MPRTLRRGFTLVELLVVMSLMIVLAGLAVAVSESGAFGSQKVVSASDRASGWLLIAKQRAIRDQRPRGVRFLIGPNGVREAQYIEVPDAWVPDRTRPVGQRAFLAFVYQQQTAGGGLFPDTWIDQASYARSATTPNGNRVFAVIPDAAEYAEFTQRVFPGSLLTLPSTGATYRIDQIIGPVPLTVGGFPPGTVGYDLVLGKFTANQPPYNTGPLFTRPPEFTYPDLGTALSPAPVATPPQTTMVEYNFAFTAGFSGGTAGTGGPLPLVGEPLLQLTGNTVIDIRLPGTGYNPATDPYPTAGPGVPVAPFNPRTTTGVTVSGGAGNQFFDVLFSPAGQVLGASDGLVALWVRDPDKTTHPRLSDPANNNGLDQPGPFDAAGEQVLVTVYTRTGLIATHPVSKGADPFAAARDGLNSGL